MSYTRLWMIRGAHDHGGRNVIFVEPFPLEYGAEEVWKAIDECPLQAWRCMEVSPVLSLEQLVKAIPRWLSDQKLVDAQLPVTVVSEWAYDDCGEDQWTPSHMTPHAFPCRALAEAATLLAHMKIDDWRFWATVPVGEAEHADSLATSGDDMIADFVSAASVPYAGDYPEDDDDDDAPDPHAAEGDE